MSPSADEAPDPREAINEQYQAMAQELLRTVELSEKLAWTEFDFEVDPFDPALDDIEGFLAQGRATPEQMSALLAPAMDRHLTLPVRLKLLREVERRIAAEMRLDVRSEAATVIKALHHLALRASTIGLLWKLYPPYVIARLRERRKELAREETDRSAEAAAREDGFASGKGDAADAAKLALPELERILFGWESSPPANVETARALVTAARAFPGRRAARTLGMVLWHDVDPAIHEAARAALVSMAEPGREIVRHHLMFHDPPPAARRALFAAAMDLGDRALVPLAVEDALGGGPWNEAGTGPAHARALLESALKAEGSVAVPVALHLFARRPPTAEVRAAAAEAFKASRVAAEFADGLARLEAGRPVVVGADQSQEEFLEKYGTFTDKMAPAAFQAEIRKMTALWESCWHEALGWRRPVDAAAEAGPRERDLLTRLARESRSALGRLAGRAPVAELEREWKVKWMTTPQNDVSGRIPLALILDERSARRADADLDRRDREEEASELYARALKAHEARMEDDARHFARAVLQIVPDHPFAKDFLARLDSGGGIPGVDAGAEAASAPRIILPG
jgi:hypothetical protein